MKRMAIAMVLAMSSVVVSAADLPSALVDPYLQVQVGLANDKIDDVAVLAKQIEDASLPLGKDAEGIVEGARKLAQAKDITAARTAFGDLSTALIDYAQKTKSGFGAGVRQAFCPMVSKPWLQKDKEIKNPYYGSAMLTCGSFKN